ncbi:MAG: hypothetical protein JWQ35_894 [Bacteriovoracaceae bacterium]|nr:hypothetical protein [Bacteriovoracaceae bacterium]
MGVGRPPGFPFNLNSAVDSLLKKEFDRYRETQQSHPYCIEAKIDAVPFRHEKIDEWRDALRKGVQFLHEATNLILTGGVDDLWINKEGEVHVVDYKATSKNSEVNLDADWQRSYKRQVEIYQWLLKNNGLTISPIAYFVYCNGDANSENFNSVLNFKIKIIEYKGSIDWVESALLKASTCLRSNEIPKGAETCQYCCYFTEVKKALNPG